MPELPEVQTTTDGLKKTTIGAKITDLWTDLDSKDIRKKETVADTKYFPLFKKAVLNKKIIKIERVAKNILIHLEKGKTILIHMKMTGHLLFGKYEFDKKKNSWKPKNKGPLRDPFNRFIHVVFTLRKNKKIIHLAFSDSRKFGKIVLIETKGIKESKHLKNLGPEPLSDSFIKKVLKDRLNTKPKAQIKTALMNQSLVAGIGNIYSDEILWHSDIHPERKIKDIDSKEWGKVFKNTKKLLLKGIDLGGDSMSDYRNIHGEKGRFQTKHKAYRKTKQNCSKRGCKGVILKKKIGGRSAHYCSSHQK